MAVNILADDIEMNFFFFLLNCNAAFPRVSNSKFAFWILETRNSLKKKKTFIYAVVDLAKYDYYSTSGAPNLSDINQMQAFWIKLVKDWRENNKKLIKKKKSSADQWKKKKFIRFLAFIFENSLNWSFIVVCLFLLTVKFSSRRSIPQTNNWFSFIKSQISSVLSYYKDSGSTTPSPISITTHQFTIIILTIRLNMFGLK